MNKNQFTSLLKQHLFSELFISQMGWNNPVSKNSLSLEIDEVTYTFQPVAQRSGFGIFSCEVESIPSASTIRRIDSRFRRAAHDYICIYYQKTGESQVWAAPVNTTEKREVIVIEYETNENSVQFLFEKIASLSFELTEQTTISTVRERIAGEFKVNGENLTKEFYRGFRQEHKAFVEFITGMDDTIATQKNLNKQWYASVMLNRLMFCYFIQKKGFLNHDEHYLRNKLQQVQETEGNNKFYSSFYRSFLLQLFHGGLNEPHRAADFERRYGRIPYLNGGLFDVHQLEKDYEDIDIADEAFARLFGFFDKWRWHLDTRITASGRDINPDVLGYIFEQYINDRAQMGAYYTKEDITEYIGKNCILPFLMDKLKEQSPEAFKPDGYVWTKLRKSGDKYIYDAVKKGVDHWDEIPDEIAQGLDTAKPNLLERRAHWNDRTPDLWALPTEIWRESIERMQRCQDIQNKIANGAITEINDFITYNLDIRQFVQDLLEETNDHLLLLHFMKALTSVSILDPTCGSGAFLFAAMNILEPLYETCINGMRKFNEENPNLFKENLAELDTKYRSNVQYFIYKTIILNNLYGVDIMHEAVEIAKLRLFLKMVAVVDVDMRADNLGLDPLPDIDFNIRCGNTLVGYATEEQLNNDLSYGDMFANLEFKDKIETEMQKVSKTFDRFRKLQLTQSPDDMQAFKDAKKKLNERLAALNDLLNCKLYQEHTAGGQSYESWLASHQPFHWLAEYYNIIHGNGGFDVIIGNPPYVEFSQSDSTYGNLNYETLRTFNLHALCVERSKIILHTHGKFGMILPIGAFSTQNMKPLMNFLEKESVLWLSFYHFRPARLFDGGKGASIPTTIFLCQKRQISQRFSTKVNKFTSETRYYLFNDLSYTEDKSKFRVTFDFCFPKLSKEIENSILTKVISNNAIARYRTSYVTKQMISYRTAGGLYWKIVIDFDFPYASTSNKTSYLSEDVDCRVITAFLNSSLQWLLCTVSFDTLNFKDYYIFNLPLDYYNISENIKSNLIKKCEDLMNNYRENAKHKYRGDTPCYEITANLAKPIIDEIDKLLAKHYGFTEEEIDFIINYDIKYRMGDELNDE